MEENKKTKNKIRIPVLIEMFFLILGIIISLMGVIRIFRFSANDWEYLVFPGIGVIFLAILFVFRRKRFAWIPGIAFLQLFLIIGGFGLICCETRAGVLRKLSYYTDKIIEAHVNDSVYQWNGETWYNKDENFQVLDNSDGNREVVVYVDGEERFHRLYNDGLNDVMFLLVVDGPPAVYLVLEKQS